MTAVRTLVACSLLLAACGDASAGGEGTPQRAVLSAEVECDGKILVVSDAIEEGAHGQGEAVRRVLVSLGMGELADTVPETLPKSGSEGFVALDESQVVFVEDGKTQGSFEGSGGSVCHTLQKEYS